ncbi:MAG: CorA family divalent cation transporter [Candidatus Delongbacteria bacterium]
MSAASLRPLAEASFRLEVRAGKGVPRPLNEPGRADPGEGYSWSHLLREQPDSRACLAASGLEPLIQEALLTPETRPRWLSLGSGLLVVLRGVNLNPGAEPEDMVALRVWLEPGRVISVLGRPMFAVQDLQRSLLEGVGPVDPGAWLAAAVRTILDRLGPVMDELGEDGDLLEEEVLRNPKAGLRRRVGQHRRACIEIRRHLAPMREVVTALSLEPDTLLGPVERAHLHEASDRLIRIVEDLDTLRDRAAVTHDELSSHLSDKINSTMFLLSLVAAIFLPLSLLTSLLGINVNGIPGADSPYAFLTVCLILLGVGGLEALFFFLRFWRKDR